MATPLEVRKVLLILSTHFPYWEKDIEPSRLSTAYGLYERLLADIPGEVLEAAALAHVSSSRFFPVVAELREQSVAIQMPLRMSALEAWSDPSDQIARKVRSLLPDYNDRAITLKEQSVIKALFIKTYEQIVQREQHEMQLLPEVRALRDRLSRNSGELAAAKNTQTALTYAGQSPPEPQTPPARSGNGPQKISGFISNLIPKRDEGTR